VHPVGSSCMEVKVCVSTITNMFLVQLQRLHYVHDVVVPWRWPYPVARKCTRSESYILCNELEV